MANPLDSLLAAPTKKNPLNDLLGRSNVNPLDDLLGAPEPSSPAAQARATPATPPRVEPVATDLPERPTESLGGLRDAMAEVVQPAGLPPPPAPASVVAPPPLPASKLAIQDQANRTVASLSGAPRQPTAPMSPTQLLAGPMAGGSQAGMEPAAPGIPVGEDVGGFMRGLRAREFAGRTLPNEPDASPRIEQHDDPQFLDALAQQLDAAGKADSATEARRRAESLRKFYRDAAEYGAGVAGRYMDEARAQQGRILGDTETPARMAAQQQPAVQQFRALAGERSQPEIGAGFEFNPTTQEQVTQATMSTAAGAVGAGIKGPMDAVAIVGRKLGADPKAIEQASAYLDQQMKLAVSDDPRLQGFWTTSVPQGVGSAIGFMALSSTGRLAGGLAQGEKGAELGTLIAGGAGGAATNGAEAWHQAKALGADDDTAFSVFLFNAGMGVSEVIPIARAFERVSGTAKGVVSRYLVNLLMEGGEEAIQENAQRIVQEITMQHAGLKPGEPIKLNDAETTAVSFIVGATVATVVQAATGFRDAGQTEQADRLDALAASMIRATSEEGPNATMRRYLGIEGEQTPAQVGQPQPDEESTAQPQAAQDAAAATEQSTEAKPVASIGTPQAQAAPTTVEQPDALTAQLVERGYTEEQIAGFTPDEVSAAMAAPVPKGVTSTRRQTDEGAAVSEPTTPTEGEVSPETATANEPPAQQSQPIIQEPADVEEEAQAPPAPEAVQAAEGASVRPVEGQEALADRGRAGEREGERVALPPPAAEPLTPPARAETTATRPPADTPAAATETPAVPEAEAGGASSDQPVQQFRPNDRVQTPKGPGVVTKVPKSGTKVGVKLDDGTRRIMERSDLRAETATTINDAQQRDDASTAIGNSEPDGLGPRLDAYRGKPDEAIEALRTQQDGYVPGALHHPQVGEIDLVWGKPGRNGYGLAKIIDRHPEVVTELPSIVAGTPVREQNENSIILESPTHEAVIRLNWMGREQRWLLTAYEKRQPPSAGRTVDVAGSADESAAAGRQAPPQQGGQGSVEAATDAGKPTGGEPGSTIDAIEQQAADRIAARQGESLDGASDGSRSVVDRAVDAAEQAERAAMDRIKNRRLKGRGRNRGGTTLGGDFADLAIIVGARAIKAGAKTLRAVVRIAHTVAGELGITLSSGEARRVAKAAVEIQKSSVNEAGKVDPDAFERAASKLRGRQKPPAPEQTVKGQIAQTTGAGDTRNEPKTVKESEALRAVMRAQESAAKAGAREGRRFAREAERARAQAVVANLRARHEAKKIELEYLRTVLRDEVIDKLPRTERADFIKALTRPNLTDSQAVEILDQIDRAFDRVKHRTAVRRFKVAYSAVRQMAKTMSIDERQSLHELFRQAGFEDASGVDLSEMNDQTREKLQELADAIDAENARREKDGQEPLATIPSPVLNQIARMGKRPVASMSAQEIDSLTGALYELMNTIRTDRKLLAKKSLLSLEQASRKATAQLEASLPELDTSRGAPRRRGLIKRAALDFYDMPIVRAMVAGGSRSSVASKLFHDNLLDGQNTYFGLIRRVDLIKKSLAERHGITEDDVIRWRKDQEDVRLLEATDPETGEIGRTVKMTRANMMYLYAQWHDPDAQRKMLQNGIKLESRKGLTRPEDSLTGSGDAMGAIALMDAVSEKLTDGQKRYVVDLSSSLQRIVRDPMNEASRALYGYEKFTNGNYVLPLLVDRTGIQEELEPGLRAVLHWLESWRSTIERVEHRNQIMVGDFFSAFDKHADQSARFAGMAVPARDALKMLGNPRYREALVRRLGQTFRNNTLEMLSDLSGLTSSPKKGSDKVASFLLRNVAVAKLGFKPTAFFNNRFGGSMMLAGFLPARVRGRFLANVARSMTLEAEGFAPWAKDHSEAMQALDENGYLYARWRLMQHHTLATPTLEVEPGGSATSVARQKLQNFRELSMQHMAFAERMNAVNLYEALRTTGMDKAAAADQVERLTRMSQNPVTPLEKSEYVNELQRRPLLALVLTFTSQNNVTRNVVRMALLEARQASTPEAKSAARWAIASRLVAASVSVAGALMIWELFGRSWDKDREDKEPMDWAYDAVGQMLDQMVPGSGSLIDAVRVATGNKTYGNEGIVKTASSKVIAAIGNTAKALDSSRTSRQRVDLAAKALEQMLLGASVFAGLPVEGPLRSGEGVYRTATEGFSPAGDENAQDLSREKRLMKKAVLENDPGAMREAIVSSAAKGEVLDIDNVMGPLVASDEYEAADEKAREQMRRAAAKLYVEHLPLVTDDIAAVEAIVRAQKSPAPQAYHTMNQLMRMAERERSKGNEVKANDLESKARRIAATLRGTLTR